VAGAIPSLRATAATVNLGLSGTGSTSVRGGSLAGVTLPMMLSRRPDHNRSGPAGELLGVASADATVE
jgi:hypothetical protein